ncbi:MAG: hypothetical protein WDA16_12165 [Candidatus Thermoplasmatota archaeon]
MRGLRSVRAAWLALLVVVPIFASAAHAQPPAAPAGVPATLSVAIEDPGHALAPGKFEVLDILLNYAVSTGGQPAPDPNDQNNLSQPTRVTFEVKSVPFWVANVTFDPPMVNITIPFPSPSDSYQAHAKAILGIARDAPALVKKEFVITATATSNGNIASAKSDSPTINIKPAFVARVNVTAPASMIVPGGRWTELPFTIKNMGNGEQKVKLNVTARPQDSQVEYPQSITIPLNGTQVVNVRIRLPWTYGELGTLDFQATPLVDGDEGKPAHAAIDVNGQSAVPAVGLPLVAFAVGALALLRRRH